MISLCKALEAPLVVMLEGPLAARAGAGTCTSWSGGRPSPGLRPATNYGRWQLAVDADDSSPRTAQAGGSSADRVGSFFLASPLVSPAAAEELRMCRREMLVRAWCCFAAAGLVIVD